MSDQAEHQIVMPFIVVTSRGGPYADDPFVAGFDLGQLDSLLGVGRPRFLLRTVRSDCVVQADLIAMRHGYEMHQRPCSDQPEWTFLEFVPVPR